ncbi:hypothetical protein A2415_03780 [candidate division WWE3 bacterium RIFOXYC1_FULL_39_7]|uniref:IMP dehydrogenase/GMP reductase domain-containing protein n=2 Tax=Katanobacteria TaxID=422282 RepID=A0A1F4X4X7_UNCKA|nr:MAG: hypothetical protein A2415_03780 [candidate division WWE3 bacterium RIFOXYC1_FULL_39_7]OGC76203.1 MAG: hypothetical protein A2619_01290 [candidate division WWE3 bacterium RIFOXYD1_FULL_39_9]
MPREHIETEPSIINTIQLSANQAKVKSIEVATSNKSKLEELERLMHGFTIIGRDLNVDEVQTLNPNEVAEKKAKAAWEKNGYNPIIVEDTSLDLAGLNGLPGTYASSFTKEPLMRKIICEEWLKDKDKRAVARVILAIYDGLECHLFEGTVEGTVPSSPRGSANFGWDDMFVPNGQPNNEQKTFAEMTPGEKDKYSMRRKAVEELLKSKLILKDYVLAIPEPYHSELKRLDLSKIEDKRAIEFAFLLESVRENKPNNEFTADNYTPLIEESNPYFLRYSFDKDSASIGLILTDVDRSETQRHKNGKPILSQVGPERRSLALAQRAEYFIKNTDKELLENIADLETKVGEFPHRSNKKNDTLETILYGMGENSNPVYARAIKELGYKKVTSEKEVSRSKIAKSGLLNKVGKYPRSVMGIGSMPAVSGWKDVILTGIVGHMPVFIPRNSIFANGVDRQIQLIKQVDRDLDKLDLTSQEKNIFRRNIGVAIGTNDPKEELKKALKLNKEAGINLFRIYTINGDPRCIEVAQLLRKELGNEVEIFAGQVTDAAQARKYLENADVDALIFGHGGGRQCTSAINGMAISTVEEIYSVITDSAFNQTSLVVEGGVGTNVGPLLIMGIDCVLYSNQIARGTIETGGLYLMNKRSEYVQPYHGSASAPTMIIEASYDNLREARINPSGRTKVPEGKPGFMKYSSKANSMAFWIDEFRHHFARTLADLGVESVWELRQFLNSTDQNLLRIVSTEAARTASAYGTNQ